MKDNKIINKVIKEQKIKNNTTDDKTDYKK